MSANAVTYPADWYKDQDEEGNETYTLMWKVKTTDKLDGPDVALSAAGLPLPGSSLSIGNTVNQWAFYNQKGSAKLASVQDSFKLWDVTTVFSTRPSKTCLDTRWGDPLLQPHRVRGNFNRVMKEAIYDRTGAVIQNSIGERLKGPAVQMPRAFPVVELEMNVAWINLAWMAEYADSVNSNVQWGQPVRTIKCTVGPWERVLYGTCYYYFVVHFTFELNYDTWDLKLENIAEHYRLPGTSTPLDPLTEIATYRDANENPIKGYVDTSGYKTTTANTLTFRVLREKDFSTVGWPASLI